MRRECVYARARTHTHTHARAHTHTYTHAHTCAWGLFANILTTARLPFLPLFFPLELRTLPAVRFLRVQLFPALVKYALSRTSGRCIPSWTVLIKLTRWRLVKMAASVPITSSSRGASRRGTKVIFDLFTTGASRQKVCL